jgi:hypothetical protein
VSTPPPLLSTDASWKLVRNSHLHSLPLPPPPPLTLLLSLSSSLLLLSPASRRAKLYLLCGSWCLAKHASHSTAHACEPRHHAQPSASQQHTTAAGASYRRCHHVGHIRRRRSRSKSCGSAPPRSTDERRRPSPPPLPIPDLAERSPARRTPAIPYPRWWRRARAAELPPPPRRPRCQRPPLPPG